MRCIYCNTQLGNEMYCPRCGADLSLPRRIVRISNLLYNKGLEKASVRDLSGAIACLQQSLKFNKENTDARNLLGLCYYETGEAVSALCEWVISKNIKSGDNLAEEYIDRLQNDRNQLDAINQSIRKYNQSVEYCRRKSRRYGSHAAEEGGGAEPEAGEGAAAACPFVHEAAGVRESQETAQEIAGDRQHQHDFTAFPDSC